MRASMMKQIKRRRLPVIRLLAESSQRYEQGSFARDPQLSELAELEQRAEQVGAAWVARQRGQIGWDRYPLRGRLR